MPLGILISRRRGSRRFVANWDTRSFSNMRNKERVHFSAGWILFLAALARELAGSLSWRFTFSIFYVCARRRELSTTWRERERERERDQLMWLFSCLIWPLCTIIYSATSSPLFIFDGAALVSLMTLLRLSWFLPDKSLSLLCCPMRPWIVNLWFGTFVSQLDAFLPQHISLFHQQQSWPLFSTVQIKISRLWFLFFSSRICVQKFFFKLTFCFVFQQFQKPPRSAL
jgi:hypothetical protein